MELIYQIPRNSLAWLLMAFLTVIAPHVPRLPVWIVIAALVCLVWRVQVHRGVWKFPPRWIKYILAGMSMFGLLVGYGRLTGLEPMVALLIIGFSMKLLEMYRRRDALAVIYLAYLVAATQLLFLQTIVAAVYMVVSVVLITTALMGLNQSQGVRYPARSLALAGKFLLQSLPLMLLLFVMIPRIGALWSVPLQEHSAKTGVSDSMSPGDFSQLTKSGDLAFRVSFEGAIPEPSERYWRGLVFSRFDGRKWSQAAPFDYFRDGQVVRWYGDQKLDWESLIEKQGRAIKYEVILEPTQQAWLYALMAPEANSADIGITRDFRLVNRTPISSRLEYEVTSYLDHSTELQRLPDWRYRNETQLPPNFNPRSRTLALKWYAESNSDEEYIRRVLAWFNQEFVYTLQPSRLGKHTADDFLLNTKRGFCEHFASAFTIMMRAAGIPARVVVGYQGGEVNPYQNYLLVHQFDAHAWTEVWLAGKGWQRIDPTAAVAPERIESGLRDMVDSRDFLFDSPLSLVRYRNILWLNKLRLQLDRMDYLWHRWVLGFDRDIREQVLTKWLGSTSALRVALAFLVVGGTILAVIAFRLLLQTRRQPERPCIKAYRRFCRRLAKLGLERKPKEAPGVFARRAINARPDLEHAIREITGLFQAVSYAGADRSEKQLLAAVGKFRPKRLK